MNGWQKAAGSFGLTVLLVTAAWAGTFRTSKEALQDKIRGGWAGTVIGCTYGGPTEFRFRGTFIQDYQKLVWTDQAIPWYFKNAPSRRPSG